MNERMNTAVDASPRTRDSAQAGAALELADVRKAYGTREALRGVTLKVDRGEFVALLGPNGAGKSTLFQLLTGLFNADSGRLAVCGHDIRKAPVAALAHLGVVFQQSTLDLDLGVAANLKFHAALHGLGGRHARDRVADALGRLGLTERAGDPVRELSGGNRRKVELARALVHEPAVLLMDEATVGLDPASRRQLLDEVLALRARGVAVLWATHLVDEAEAADRVVVLHRGQILAEGRPQALADQAGTATLADAFLQMTGGGGERSD
ncbi:MAG: ABC-2 type transport system ATP-binding protein [Azoarcus sp.]|uniref:ABC-2 type transport system ATP-binding protein n=2 Tax=Aromatoleum tolulyticum TaxID=34027 RepID=A0A1N6YII3_9RHOO|nr:ABC-2 type transport system ATP-binding protein [Azoarcus sp.]SIR14360.1 ABC-2 type transport system ATP-binding protein [Aromatoleum tolulyticum]